MDYRVVFAPEAEEQLAALYRYIARVSSPKTALSYTESIISYCESLELFPERGNQRNDIFPGLRVTNHSKRTLTLLLWWKKRKKR
ncbi:ParE-like toxin [Pectobacterium versatile]|nr:ParE-like toxin [Pectobacterium versatile]